MSFRTILILFNAALIVGFLGFVAFRVLRLEVQQGAAAREPHAVLRRRRARGRAPRAGARRGADRAGHRRARPARLLHLGAVPRRPRPRPASRSASVERGATLFANAQSKEYDSTKSLLCATCHGVDGGGGIGDLHRAEQRPALRSHREGHRRHAGLLPAAAGRVGRAEPAARVAALLPRAAHADHHLRQTGHTDARVGCASGQGRAPGAEHPGPRELRREPGHHVRRRRRPSDRPKEVAELHRAAPRASAASSSRIPTTQAAADKWVVDAQAELAAAQALLADSGVEDVASQHQAGAAEAGDAAGRRELAGDDAVAVRRRHPLHEQLRPLPHPRLVVLRRHRPGGEPAAGDHGWRRLRPEPHRRRREQPVPAAQRRGRSWRSGSASACPPTTSTASAASRPGACRTSAPSSPRPTSSRSWRTSDRCRSAAVTSILATNRHRIWYPTILGILVVVAGGRAVHGVRLRAARHQRRCPPRVPDHVHVAHGLPDDPEPPLAHHRVAPRVAQGPGLVVEGRRERQRPRRRRRPTAVHGVNTKANTPSSTDASNVKAAVDAALVTKVSTPTIDRTRPTTTASPSSHDVTKFMILQTWTVGGSNPQFWKGEFNHTTKYAVVEYCKTADQTQTFGLPPLPPECASGADAQRGYVVVHVRLRHPAPAAVRRLRDRRASSSASASSCCTGVRRTSTRRRRRRRPRPAGGRAPMPDEPELTKV